MIGAIIGDIVGSRFEWHNHRNKKFDFYHRCCFATDDSIMTISIAKALLESKSDFSDLGSNSVRYMREIGSNYPNCGYGGAFFRFIFGDHPRPYNSWGNGAAMRISAVPYAAASLEEVKRLSRAVTEVSHNHPEGIKGAEATAVCAFLALQGESREDIKKYVQENYYPLDFTIDGIRATYEFNESCQDTVPQAIEAFLESTSFEDAIRTAVSVGGDSDTLAAITGGIAEAYYGVPTALRDGAKRYLDDTLLPIVEAFEQKYPPKIAN